MHVHAMSGVFSMASHCTLQYLPVAAAQEHSGCAHFFAFSLAMLPPILKFPSRTPFIVYIAREYLLLNSNRLKIRAFSCHVCANRHTFPQWILPPQRVLHHPPEIVTVCHVQLRSSGGPQALGCTVWDSHPPIPFAKVAIVGWRLMHSRSDLP
jgi:hypothetical protein